MLVGRYRALSINPGTCVEDRTSTNFNKMKGVILNLRSMIVERCIDLEMVGCGDGSKISMNNEQCDDGNFINGDGCSKTCQIETYWNCTTEEGELSTCVPIYCGNGVYNAGEECDDGN